jgi:hypothetical protein
MIFASKKRVRFGSEHIEIIKKSSKYERSILESLDTIWSKSGASNPADFINQFQNYQSYLFTETSWQSPPSTPEEKEQRFLYNFFYYIGLMELTIVSKSGWEQAQKFVTDLLASVRKECIFLESPESYFPQLSAYNSPEKISDSFSKLESDISNLSAAVDSLTKASTDHVNVLLSATIELNRNKTQVISLLNTPSAPNLKEKSRSFLVAAWWHTETLSAKIETFIGYRMEQNELVVKRWAQLSTIITSPTALKALKKLEENRDRSKDAALFLAFAKDSGAKLDDKTVCQTVSVVIGSILTKKLSDTELVALMDALKDHPSIKKGALESSDNEIEISGRLKAIELEAAKRNSPGRSFVALWIFIILAIAGFISGTVLRLKFQTYSLAGWICIGTGFLFSLIACLWKFLP